MTLQGIGSAICRNLANKGCNIVLNYTSDSSAKLSSDLAKQLEDEHGIATACIQADMESESGPKYLVESVKNRFAHPKTGKFQLDIIINNAGISVNREIGECDAEDFAKQYNVNVRGPLFLVQAAIPYLPQDRSGRIVNISSVSSSLGYISQSVYGGTKAALESMTRTWARELAERATVNAVNPGPVATEMYNGTTKIFQERNAPFIKNAPLAAPREEVDGKEWVERSKEEGGRPAWDFEVAGIVGMLCTSDAAWCTGSVVCANGGMKFSF